MQIGDKVVRKDAVQMRKACAVCTVTRATVIDGVDYYLLDQGLQYFTEDDLCLVEVQYEDVY